MHAVHILLAWDHGVIPAVASCILGFVSKPCRLGLRIADSVWIPFLTLSFTGCSHCQLRTGRWDCNSNPVGLQSLFDHLYLRVDWFFFFSKASSILPRPASYWWCLVTEMSNPPNSTFLPEYLRTVKNVAKWLGLV